jgi:hypothetical protein
LLALNLAVLIGRDMNDVARLRAQADAQQPAFESVSALRQRVLTEDARRRVLLSLARDNDPLRLLNALTQALPPGAWVQRLEWNGKVVHLVGYKSGDIDIPAVLRGSGEFANPQIVTPSPTAGPTPVRQFEVTAEARPQVHR